MKDPDKCAQLHLPGRVPYLGVFLGSLVGVQSTLGVSSPSRLQFAFSVHKLIRLDQDLEKP